MGVGCANNKMVYNNNWGMAESDFNDSARTYNLCG